jgi:hypothetical protein
MTNRSKYLTAISAVVFSVAAFSPVLADCSSGFIASALCQAGLINKETANALDAAHKNLGQAADSLDSLAATKGPEQQTVRQSKTCVTPRQVCDLPSSALRGTTCFCGTDDFGRAQ